MTRFEARSLEAKTKWWKKKRGGIKGAAHEKWIRVIASLLEGYPNAYVNYNLETLDDMEAKFGKKTKKRKEEEKEKAEQGVKEEPIDRKAELLRS